MNADHTVQLRPPDIVAQVRFFAPDEGGRKRATPPDVFRCAFEFDRELFDCGLHLADTGAVAPGQTVVVPITFLRPEYVKPRLVVGSRFSLWELGHIAEGEVSEIL